jgi:hypothetical protein
MTATSSATARRERARTAAAHPVRTPLRRLRDWLLEEHLDGPTCADRAFIATVLRFGPPH